LFDEHNTIRIRLIIRRFILSQPNKNTLSKYALTISLIFIAVIIALPYGIKFGLIKGLAQSGAKQVTIDDVDFNLFTGKLFISHLRAKKQQDTELSVDSLMLQVDWLPLFKKRYILLQPPLRTLLYSLKTLMRKRSTLVEFAFP